MQYLADTHAIVWYFLNSSKLGTASKKLLSRLEYGSVHFSTVSYYEIAQLESLGRLKLGMNLRDLFAEMDDTFVPLGINGSIAITAANLALPHGDPFDRIITATAKYHNLVLITKDHLLQDSGLVETIW